MFNKLEYYLDTYNYGEVSSGSAKDTFIRKVDANQQVLWTKIYNSTATGLYGFDVSSNEQHIFFTPVTASGDLTLIQLSGGTGSFVGGYKSTNLEASEQLTLLEISPDNTSVFVTGYALTSARLLCRWTINGGTALDCFNLLPPGNGLVPRGIRPINSTKILYTVQFGTLIVELRLFDFSSMVNPNLWSVKFTSPGANVNGENNIITFDPNIDRAFYLVHADDMYLMLTLNITNGAVLHNR